MLVQVVCGTVVDWEFLATWKDGTNPDTVQLCRTKNAAMQHVVVVVVLRVFIRGIGMRQGKECQFNTSSDED